MKLSLLLALLVMSSPALSCVCDEPQGSIEKWVAAREAEADYIFVARITHVESPPRYPRLEESATIEILKNIKGAAKLRSITAAWCQNFELRQGESRVFFVAKDGVIQNCSNYKSFMSNEELLKKLHATTDSAN